MLRLFRTSDLNELSSTTTLAPIDRAGEKVERKVRGALNRVPARISLLTGSVLVLVTLYLPLAVDSCGRSSGFGKDIAMGKHDAHWPGFFNFFDLFDYQEAGRWFYVFLLAWAALALLLLLFSLGIRKVGGSGRLTKALYVVGGAASLFVLADYTMAFIVLGLASALQWLTRSNDWGEGALPFGLLLLAAAGCLRHKALRSDLVAALPLILACALLVSGVGVGTYAELLGMPSDWNDAAGNAFFLGTYCLFFLAPLLAWLRFGFARSADRAAQWPQIRRRLALALVPAVAGHGWAAYMAIFEVHVWGLVPCLFGIHLITLGYMRLVREASRSLAVQAEAGVVSAPTPHTPVLSPRI